MDFLKVINKYRRKATRRITKRLLSSNTKKIFDIDDLTQIKRILICRPNHRLGNLLLITPIVQEVISIFPDCKVDLFVKGGLAPIIFRNYKNIDSYIKLPKKPFKHLFKYFKTWVLIRKKKYDMVINVTSESSSGRLATKFSRSDFKIFGNEIDDLVNVNENYYHNAKNPVINFRQCMTNFGNKINREKINCLDIKLSQSELKEGKKTLNKIVSNKKETISLFTYATGNKCYTKSWWNTFYNELKTKYKNYNIIEILPIENVSQIEFKAPSFYSVDIRKIAAFIANTSVFIGADSGIMHLASSSLSPTIGLFSVTLVKKYQPYCNGSIAIHTINNSIKDCFDELDKILAKN